MSEDRPLELEPSGAEFTPVEDKRPKMPEPLPVRLIAVGDVSLPSAAGLEGQLDKFYAEMLEFQRDPELPLAYQSDNFRIIFETREPPFDRDGYRILQIEIEALRVAEQKLIDAELEYTRQRGLVPGTESLVLVDPAGNWIELVEAHRVL